MTPPPPLPDGVGVERTSRLRRDPVWAGWGAAGLIALSVIVAVLQVVRDKGVEAAVTTPGAGATERLEAEVGARYIVGMNAVFGPMLESAGQPKQAWLAPLEAAAQSPRQELELKILRRELGVLEKAGIANAMRLMLSDESRRDWETWDAIQSSPSEAGAPLVVGEAERQRFEERYGWFARLALSHGLPADDELRTSVIGQARRTFFGTLLLIFGVFGGLALGCVLGFLAVVRFATGRSAWRFSQIDRPVVVATGGSVWLETFAVYLTVMVLGGALADFLPADWAPWPQAVAFLGSAALGLWWPAMRGLTRGDRCAGFGWHGGSGVGREVVAGLVGYVAGLPIIAMGVGLTLFLTLMTKADASHPLNHLTGVPVPMLVLLAMLASVWAPVVEELFFRGAFYAAWRQRWGRWFSGLATGVIFAAVHPQGWTAIPALGAVGLVLALLREWRGTIVAPITAHALNNGTLFLMMLVILR
ncbi:MAG: lysostaphin resistance A-like protein [Verrucomicrobiales bacterium]